MPPQQDVSSLTNTNENMRNDASEKNESRSSFEFPAMQQTDPFEEPLLRRASTMRRESFIVQFAKTKGPPQITLLMMLVAIGLGSTIGKFYQAYYFILPSDAAAAFLLSFLGFIIQVLFQQS